MFTRTIIGLLLIAYICPAYQPSTPSKLSTDDERNHAKLHAQLHSLNSMGVHDLRSAVADSPSHHVITYIEGGSMVTSPNPPRTGEEWVHRITCGSDLVVLGHVTKQISSLSENGATVFSDYYFQIAKTVYAKQPFNLKRLVVLLPGGRVETPDGIIETRLKALYGIPVGGPPFHLLFLRRMEQEGMPNDSFLLTNLYGSFFLFPDHPKSFSAVADKDVGLERLLRGMSRDQMIEAVKQSTVVCGGRSEMPQ